MTGQRPEVVMARPAVELGGDENAPGPFQELDGAFRPSGRDRRLSGMHRQVSD
jgi:hypothetical protein